MARRPRPPALRRGELYWVQVPAEQAEGREYRDSDNGNARAWLIVSDPRVHQSGVVVAIPTTTNLGALQLVPEGLRAKISAEEVTQVATDKGE